MAQSGMALLFRLNNTVAANSADFIKFSHSCAYYQDATLKKYLLRFLRIGHFYARFHTDFKFFKFNFSSKKYKFYTQLLWHNICTLFLIYDSVVLSEIDGFAIKRPQRKLDAHWFNIIVLKSSDWVVINCCFFNNIYVLNKSKNLLSYYISSYNDVNNKFVFSKCRNISLWL